MKCSDGLFQENKGLLRTMSYSIKSSQNSQSLKPYFESYLKRPSVTSVTLIYFLFLV